MKKGKSTGDDGIPLEIIETGGEVVIQKLFKECQRAYETEKAHSDWQRGVISPLLKKSEKQYVIITEGSCFCHMLK